MRPLSQHEERFIIHWGEMGTRWGINRVVAQIYALLYISEEPLNAEEISEALSLARSTISTGLRELQSWKIIHVRQKLGDRRDYFEALDDVWETFRLVLDERKRREFDPTQQLLRDTVASMEAEGAGDTHAYGKLADLLNFFDTMLALYAQIQTVSLATLQRLARTRDLISRAVGLLGGRG